MEIHTMEWMYLWQDKKSGIVLYQIAEEAFVEHDGEPILCGFNLLLEWVSEIETDIDVDSKDPAREPCQHWDKLDGK